ncbi:MAG: DcaP family trimeric outer membrane transporter [Planctomycetota bacterium]|jgi:hypothetical protein
MNRKLVLWIGVLLVAAVASAATDTETLQKENADLKQRVEKLESQVSRLVELLESKPVTTTPVDQGQFKGLDDASLEKLAAMVAEKENGGKKPILSSLDMDVYGFVRLDTAWDDSSVADGGGGSYLKWADSGGNGDDQFSMTARASRVGVNIRGPKENGLQTSGKLEIDFAGGGSETSNEIRMRQAYMNLDWYDKDFSLLAGQSWDIASPLNPPTIDFGVLWWAGNLGWRRPQIRATQGYDLSNGNKMTLQGAATMALGRDTLAPEGTSYKNSGTEAGFPHFQYRVGFDLGKTKLGFSGHWGREEYDLDASRADEDFDTWSANVDLVQPLNDWITLKGEAFTGQNLNNYAGGIGQGVNTSTLTEYESVGGWAALCMKPYEKWTFNVGYGIEDMDNDDLAAGGRTQNSAIFGNAVYALNKHTDIGLEIQNRDTKYKNADDGDDLRVQAMFRYKF